MAEKKLRFQAKIEGKEAGIVAAITPPVNVIEHFGTRWFHAFGLVRSTDIWRRCLTIPAMSFS